MLTRSEMRPESVPNTMMDSPKSSIIDMSTILSHHENMTASPPTRFVQCPHNQCVKCCSQCNLHNNILAVRRQMLIDRLAIIITIMALTALGLMATFMILSLTNL